MDFDDVLECIKDDADSLRDICIDFENKIEILGQQITDMEAEIEDLKKELSKHE